MFRELGSKIVELYQDDLAIKKDAHNFILFGGLLGAFCIWAVHDVPKSYLMVVYLLQPPSRVLIL